MKYFTFIPALVLSIALPLCAQVSSPRIVYAFLGVKTPEYIKNEGQSVERRMIGELVRLGSSENFSLITPRNRDALLQNILLEGNSPAKAIRPFLAGELPSARGMIIGQLSRSEEIYRFQLELLRTENLSVTNAVQKNYPGLEPLLDDIPPMLGTLFELPDQLHAPLPPIIAGDSSGTLDGSPLRSPVRTKLSDLEGSWKPETGAGILDSIRIDADGNALAHLGGWNLMLLAVNIENGSINIRQDEPNSPKLYMNSYPYSLAVRISEIARPLQWIFTLSADGNTLTGILKSTSFQIEQGEILSWDDTHTRPASWIRTSRK